MRPIKFRGIFPGGGLVAYGDLIHTKRGVFIQQDTGGQMEVEPDSVAQLVGYDANGKEVYEGDILIDKNGYEFVATIQSVGCCKSAASIPVESRPVDFDLIQRFTPLTLKEDNQ